jgi:putative DNA primase/helicase
MTKSALESGVSLLALCAREPETDIGNGRRFIHRFGRDVLYIARIGWHGFDGRRWREDDNGTVVRPLAQNTAEAILFEAKEIVLDEGALLLVDAGNEAEQDLAAAKKSKDPERILPLEKAIRERDRIFDDLDRLQDRRKSHYKSSCGSGKMDNMLAEAAPHLNRRMEDMNGDDLALNCQNGTLRFVKELAAEAPKDAPFHRWFARLDPHSREDNITKLCEAEVCGRDGLPLTAGPALIPLVDLEMAAEKLTPVFTPFIQRVQPDPMQRAYLQRLHGYMLTGLTSEQMICFWYGIGANGKSTMADVFGRILSDYCVTLSIDSFTGDAKRDGAAPTPDLVRLNGATSCFAAEGDEGVALKEGLVKSLTGGDKLPVRKMREEFVEISIKAKFVIVGNHKPKIKNDDDGIWRRIHLFEWPIQIPADERDKALPAKLFAERNGILAWAIAGLIEFLSLGGLAPPDAVVAAVAEHREESDSMGAFIRGGCEVTGASMHSEGPGNLHLAYVDYCKTEGLYPLHQSTFNRRLPELTRRTWPTPDGRMAQFAKSKTGGVSVYKGILIKERFRPGRQTPEPDDRPFAPPE